MQDTNKINKQSNNGLEVEEKLAEVAMQESGELYRDLLDNANDLIQSVGPNGHFIYTNKKWRAVLGYSEEDIAKLTLWDVVHPDYLQLMRKGFQSLMSGGALSNAETILVAKDGKLVNVEGSSSCRFENGKPVFTRGILRDITEHKQTEEKLAAQYSTLHSIIESTDAAIFSVDQRYCYTSFNKKHAATMKAIYGKDIEIGRSILEYQTVSEDREKAKRNLDRALAGERCVEETFSGEEKLSRMFFEVSHNPIPGEDGAVIGAVVLARDITERKKTEEALTDSEEKYRTLVERANDGICIIQDGTIKYTNSRLAEIWGGVAEELTNTSFINYVHPDSLPTVVENYNRRMAGEQVPSVYETTLKQKGGDKVYVELNIGIINYLRKPAELVITRDITERKRLEEELKKSQRMDAIGTLAGGIAHDFNNALTGIMGNIQLAESYLKQDKKETVEEVLSEAEKAALDAKHLTQQLLTFARGGAPVKKVISLNSLLRESTAFALRGSNVAPEFAIEKDLWVTAADEGQINQVIGNIVINARQAVPTGGTITVSAKNAITKANQIPLLTKGEYVEIAIEDHGIGIPRNHFVKIFEPYFTTKGTGSGLGLATSFSIVKNHGGTITFESELGVGTTFYVYLPAVKGKIEEDTLERSAAAKVVPVKHGRILIMDDEDSILTLLTRILISSGFEVETSKNGEEAVNKYSEAKKAGKPFDAVILDLTIPGGMGGKETITKLLEIDPKVKAIVSSGYANDPIMAGYKQYGFSGVVAKPYDLNVLKETVDNILAGK